MMDCPVYVPTHMQELLYLVCHWTLEDAHKMFSRLLEGLF